MMINFTKKNYWKKPQIKKSTRKDKEQFWIILHKAHWQFWQKYCKNVVHFKVHKYMQGTPCVWKLDKKLQALHSVIKLAARHAYYCVENIHSSKPQWDEILSEKSSALSIPQNISLISLQLYIFKCINKLWNRKLHTVKSEFSLIEIILSIPTSL